ncbi:MAG: glutamine amidotransferase [Bifidobacteriaceae bacterium]|jgi:CobQ-like glutamine amidotransferase family enzyme|nr:glutamine amidotransferase [Bifidobacteriaceae bacterium]
MKLKVMQLYSHDMNIYGDCGNILALQRKIEQFDLKAEIIEYNQGDIFPKDVDIIIGGGGQDSGQNKVIADLYKISDKLKAAANDGVPMLMVCGLYQLFGKFFKTHTGETLKGINIFNIETFGKNRRLIGNVIAQSRKFGTLLGYENHSGQTYLLENAAPLAEKVTLGVGNNEDSSDEGCIYKNCLGTYLHGSILPKNPAITDFLIISALKNKGYKPLQNSFDKYNINKFTALARNKAKTLKR